MVLPAPHVRKTALIGQSRSLRFVSPGISTTWEAGDLRVTWSPPRRDTSSSIAVSRRASRSFGASVERLGLAFSDIEVLLISHAHWDHDAGSAAIKKLTGAKYMVMDADVGVVESGGKTDFQYGSVPADLYPPTKVDRVLHDGDQVTLGGATLVAHLTPGHTKGCTTWTMTVHERDITYDAVIICSLNVNPGYQLVNNRQYPEIAADYERAFRVMKSLPCDLFLGAHGAYFGLDSKYAQLTADVPTPFVDPDGYTRYVAEREAAFRAVLAKQQTAASMHVRPR